MDLESVGVRGAALAEEMEHGGAGVDGVSFEIGGSTPKASAVRKITFSGCPPTLGMTTLSINSSGYAARVAPHDESVFDFLNDLRRFSRVRVPLHSRYQALPDGGVIRLTKKSLYRSRDAVLIE